MPKRERRGRSRDGDGMQALQGDGGIVSARQGHNKWVTVGCAG